MVVRTAMVSICKLLVTAPSSLVVLANLAVINRGKTLSYYTRIYLHGKFTMWSALKSTTGTIFLMNSHRPTVTLPRLWKDVHRYVPLLQTVSSFPSPIEGALFLVKSLEVSIDQGLILVGWRCESKRLCGMQGNARKHHI